MHYRPSREYSVGSYLESRPHIDGVGVGARSRERRLGLGHVAHGEVDVALEEVELHKQLLCGESGRGGEGEIERDRER